MESAGSRLARFADPRRALSLFQSLEGLRLDARLAEELPGLWREMVRPGRVLLGLKSDTMRLWVGTIGCRSRFRPTSRDL